MLWRSTLAVLLVLFGNLADAEAQLMPDWIEEY